MSDTNDTSNGDNTPSSAPTPAPSPSPESAPAGAPSASPSPSPAPSPSSVPAVSSLNPQIVDAVNTTNQVVLGASGKEGAAIAYQKVAQAAAFSVQDATDYLRNVMTMASTATGVCLQLMIAKETTSPYTDIITAATDAVTAAQKNFSAVGEAAGTVVSDFPSGS